MNKHGIRLITAVVTSSMIVTPVLAAPSVDDLKKEKAAKQNEVSSLQSQLTTLMGKVNTLESELIQTGEDYPYELVKSRFLKLNSSHLEYVIGCMKETTTKITNIKAYMITALYNAPTTINHFYQQEVQHDMYGGGWHEKGII